MSLPCRPCKSLHEGHLVCRFRQLASRSPAGLARVSIRYTESLNHEDAECTVWSKIAFGQDFPSRFMDGLLVDGTLWRQFSLRDPFSKLLGITQTLSLGLPQTWSRRRRLLLQQRDWRVVCGTRQNLAVLCQGQRKRQHRLLRAPFTRCGAWVSVASEACSH